MSESLLVGAYAVLISSIIWLLLTARGSQRLAHKILFGASIVMFLISVAHLGLVMQQVSVDVLPDANLNTQIVLASLQFVIGDLVLIWRVWIIWDRKYWVAAGPLSIMIATAVFTLYQTKDRTFFTVAPVILIVANTSICTLLIAGRIWYMQCQLRETGDDVCTPSRRTKKAVLLIIESGALYTAVQIVSLILYHTKSPGLAVLLNMEIPLIGILPTLLIILVYFNMVTGADDSSTMKKPPTSTFRIESQLRDSIYSGRLSANGTGLSSTIESPLEFEQPSGKKPADALHTV